MARGKRRLAAIMFTDIAGYASLSHKDENIALDLLEEHRRLVRPVFRKHGGSEIKTTGDGFLVEFSSALEATRCACEIQRTLRESNSGGFSRGGKERMRVRIGVHLGDIVHREGDVYGDAVNIASRVENLAVAGGICVTRQVYDQVKNKVEFPLSPIGEVELRNIDEPVEVFRVVLPWEKDEGAPARKKAENALPLNAKRVAVLPFVNISPDPKDEYLADGMTEEIIARLARVAGFDIIARTSVMNYKKKEKSVSQIGKELGAGSLLEGSVRKSGNKIRVTVQLIDSHSESHIWSEIYNRSLDDIFEVQSEVAEEVAGSLEVRLSPRERRDIETKPTTNMEAYSMYLKGRMIWSEQTQSAFKRALKYFEHAVELDSGFALAHAGIADCYSLLGEIGFLPQREAIGLAEAAAKKAVELDERLPEAHLALAPPRYHRYDLSGADVELRRAIELRPSFALAHAWRGVILRIRGRLEEALEEFTRARDLDPYSPHMNNYVASTLRLMRRFDEAVDQARRSLELSPSSIRARQVLGMIYLDRSMFTEAIKEFKAIDEAEPEAADNVSTLGVAYAMAGRREEAAEELKKLEKIAAERYVGPDHFAVVYLMLGEKEKAYALFSRAVDELCTAWTFGLGYNHIFDPYRSDEQFKALVKRIGLKE